jgi:hypothetical protein
MIWKALIFGALATILVTAINAHKGGGGGRKDYVDQLDDDQLEKGHNDIIMSLRSEGADDSAERYIRIRKTLEAQGERPSPLEVAQLAMEEENRIEESKKGSGK